MTQDRSSCGCFRLWLVLGLYAALVLAVMLRHEMWRDEFQAWLIAKESLSLTDLWRNSRYEGHPLLWFFSLYGLTRFSQQPAAMQVLHLLVASGAAAVFLRYSPFSWAQRVLFIFGYFFFFEYGVISRNYALGVLFLLGFLAAWRPGGDKPYLGLALLLALLCQTSLYGLVLAICLTAMLAFEVLTARPPGPFWRDKGSTLAAGALLAGLSMVLAALSIHPPMDFSPPLGGALLPGRFDLGKAEWAAAGIWRSYLPLPALEGCSWNTNLVSSVHWQFFLSLLLWLFFLLSFWRQPVVCFLYAAGTGALWLLSYVLFTGGLRHHGHFFLLLTACLWLTALAPAPAGKSPGLQKISSWCQEKRKFVVLFILWAQVLTAAAAAWLDYWRPFSASRAAAAYIRGQGLEDRLILGDTDYTVTPISAYLDRKVYYPASDRLGSFVIWDSRRKPVDKGRLLERARELGARQQREVLLVLNYPYAAEDSLVLLSAFTETMVPEEVYYLYVLKSLSLEKTR